MSAAALLLRQALREALIAHAPLVALLGGPKVHDEPPRAAAFPYVTLGEARTLDWSTGTSSGAEHQIALNVWSAHGGQKEAHLIAAEVMAALEAAPLPMTGHHLVNLRFASADLRREPDGRAWRALIRFRAVTEKVAA